MCYIVHRTQPFDQFGSAWLSGPAVCASINQCAGDRHQMQAYCLELFLSFVRLCARDDCKGVRAFLRRLYEIQEPIICYIL